MISNDWNCIRLDYDHGYKKVISNIKLIKLFLIDWVLYDGYFHVIKIINLNNAIVLYSNLNNWMVPSKHSVKIAFYL